MCGFKGFRKLVKDETGATLVYVSVMLAVLVGMVGLSADFARLYIADTQAQAAADAAAIAGASQLDGLNGAITRATNAAQTTPLVANAQNFAAEANAAADVQITNIRFLSDLPASDSTPIAGSMVTSDQYEAEYIEVTTESLTHTNLFLTALNITKDKTITATAVAGHGSAICRVTPLMICNPAESGAGGQSFEISNWKGKQVIAHEHGGGNTSWAPGNFGFLNVPGLGNGASALADTLASVDGADTCFDTRVDTQPGAINALRSALNVRFDIYENPFFKNADNDPEFAPAANVTKGRVWNNPNNCNAFSTSGAQGLPQDKVFGNPTSRFGNGIWDCAAYWAANHSSAAPTGCNANSNAGTTFSRYDVYRYEIDNGEIPSASSGTSTENGAPVCTNQTVVDNPARDRRLLNFAVINCIEHDIKGNSTDVPVEAFVRAFLTEPVGDPATPGASDFDLYMEIVDVVQPGKNNGELKEFVEIYR